MTSSLTQSVALSASVARNVGPDREANRVRAYVLSQVLFCALPVSALIALGKVTWAGWCCWGLFGVLALRLLGQGRHNELVCLLIGLTPFLTLLRQAIIYNSILVTFLGLLIYFRLRSPKTVQSVLRRTPLALGVWLIVGVYYAISLALTREYFRNLRFFELAAAATCILLVGRNRALLGVSLLGLLVSAIAVGLAMLPHNDSVGRLGLIVVEGQSLGNPSSLGLPLAVGFLALTVDRGRWVGLDRKLLWRVGLGVVTVVLLMMTTSRMAWLVAGGGLVTVLLFQRRARLRTLLVVALAALTIQGVLLSPYGENVQKGIRRTFNPDRSAASRTSGRSDQWLVAYAAFTDSLGSIVHGYGPGRGPAVYARFSSEVEGIKYRSGKEAALHALFMQVMVEAGLLGLVPLTVGLVAIAVHVLHWTAKTGWFFPPICILSYLFSVATVAGCGLMDGYLLGIGLLTTMRIPVKPIPVNRMAEDSVIAKSRSQPVSASGPRESVLSGMKGRNQ